MDGDTSFSVYGRGRLGSEVRMTSLYVVEVSGAMSSQVEGFWGREQKQPCEVEFLRQETEREHF